MKGKTGSIKRLLIFMLLLLIFVVGFTGVKQQAASVSGTIDKVDKDHKSVIVSGQKIWITPGTKIIDEKGNDVKTVDLKQSHWIQVEGLRNANGFIATKVLIKPAKRNP